MIEHKQYLSLEEKESNGASRRYEVSIGGMSSGITVVVFKTESSYNVELGLDYKTPLYSAGSWVTKTKIAYWNNSGADREIEERLQAQDHEGQVSWCMGSIFSNNDIRDSVYDFILSEEGASSIALAQLKAVKLNLLLAKQIEQRQGFLAAFIDGDWLV